ncbi:unnamed protein product [Lepeophtheirus salmonis]|uniref:(salmon louse) hypothetical protein n=1 Tax=Lepeophtheirus salmonis TaxID=72036 RepID=A0A7R8H367_LEPSM|nr:unnamed protein product [Lepeophtheirus salmonis]CAF2839513.1 unnamed protein product [Lepeophtheirus salmonis]
MFLNAHIPNLNIYFVVMKNNLNVLRISSVYMVRKGIAYTVLHVTLTNLNGIFPFVIKYNDYGQRDSASLIYKVGFGISCSTYLGIRTRLLSTELPKLPAFFEL